MIKLAEERAFKESLTSLVLANPRIINNGYRSKKRVHVSKTAVLTQVSFSFLVSFNVVGANLAGL